MATTPDAEASRRKWDARYRNSHNAANSVAEVLRRNRQLLPAAGKALDLATGLGGNALFLAERGLEVAAWDISPVALAKLNQQAQQRGLTLHTQCRDIIAQPPEPESFDLIVVSRFLERSLCPAISAALKPGGLLFYQTYTRANKGGEGPRNPHFLLAAGELPKLFSNLQVLAYEEGGEVMFVGRRGAAGL